MNYNNKPLDKKAFERIIIPAEVIEINDPYATITYMAMLRFATHRNEVNISERQVMWFMDYLTEDDYILHADEAKRIHQAFIKLAQHHILTTTVNEINKLGPKEALYSKFGENLGWQRYHLRYYDDAVLPRNCHYLLRKRRNRWPADFHGNYADIVHTIAYMLSQDIDREYTTQTIPNRKELYVMDYDELTTHLGYSHDFMPLLLTTIKKCEMLSVRQFEFTGKDNSVKRFVIYFRPGSNVNEAAREVKLKIIEEQRKLKRELTYEERGGATTRKKYEDAQ